MRRVLIFDLVLAGAVSLMSASATAVSQALAAQGANRPEKVLFHSTYRTAEAVSGRFSNVPGATRLERALSFIAGRQDIFRMVRPQEELALLSEKTDGLGKTHLRFQQVFGGVPVWGCQTIVHFEDDRTIYLVGGQTVPTPTISTVASVSAAGAESRAIAALKDQSLPADVRAASELVIYPNDGNPRLAQLVTVTSARNGGIRWQVFVDAQSGTVLHRFNDVHFDGPDIGSGPDVLDINQVFPIYLQSGQYKMINTTHTGTITTYENYYGGGPISTDPDGDKIWDDNVGEKAAVSAHYNTDLTYAYFKNTFGRESYDALGHSVMANVHDSAYVNNAYWNGQGINFADGDGVNYRPFSGSLDVVAHEFTHGVTQYTAGLIYQYQSGALNESISDVFGCMVDRDEWLLGEEIRITAPFLIRSMSNPSVTGQPMDMSSYRTYDISKDNGGVHTNSGITNYCYYWVAELIGKDKAEQIWFRTLTTYLTPSSGFYFFAGMVLQSSRDLYGTTYDAQVLQGLNTVGLNTAYAMPEAMSISIPLGGAAVDSIWVHNPGPGACAVTAVAPAFPGLTLAAFGGNHPSIPAGDSAGFEVSAQGSGLVECNIGAINDTLRFDATAGVDAQIKIPLSYGVSYVQAGYQTPAFATSCLGVTVTNTGAILSLSRGGVEAVYQGSLLLGRRDGTDTTTYRDVFGTMSLVPVDTVHSASGLKSFRIATETGHVLGSVTYTYDPTDADSCDFVIAEYKLRNPCDTALSLLVGLVCDFDIINSSADLGNYDAPNQMVYMSDGSNTQAAGFALLSGSARNLRILNNPTMVWNGAFTDGLAYTQMSLTSNVAGSGPNDYSALLTFGDAQIPPGGSVSYKVAMLRSASGTAGLSGILTKAKAFRKGCCVGTRGNANNDPLDKANVADATYLLAWLFGIPSGPAPVCMEEANVNADLTPGGGQKVNVSDVTYMLAWLFGIPSGPAPKACP